jgi:hypothetical protein
MCDGADPPGNQQQQLNRRHDRPKAWPNKAVENYQHSAPIFH